MAIQPTALARRAQLPAARAKHISILLADETQMGCQILRNALVRSNSQFKVVDCATNRGEILRALQAHPIEVAVVSESLQEGPHAGFEVLSEVRASYPHTRVIFLLKSASEQMLVEAFRAGAKGVFCKSEPIQGLRKSIQAVSKGQVWANSRQLNLILEALAGTTPPWPQDAPKAAVLAKREEEVANLVAEGLTNREVAAKLGLCEHTVSNYLFRIYDKLGLSSRVELVLYLLNQRQQSGKGLAPLSPQG
jgi:DNA-binding NarL/FixJ family response regulator